MKKLFLALLLSAATLCVLLTGCGGGKTPTSDDPSILESDADRVEYLRELGWKVDEVPIDVFEFQLPETLEEPYLSYNAIQLPQGFDLGQYCGESVTRYSYAVLNHPKRETGVQADLYLCDGVPIAGSIFCPGVNGFIEPLIQTSSDADD